MAKKQTRRTVSMNRDIYIAALAHSAQIGRPLSQIVEDLLLIQLGDTELTARIATLRETPAGAKPPIDLPGRHPSIRQPTEEDRVDCSGMFHGVGRKPDPDCKSRRAAELVLQRGFSQAEAARTVGVKPAVVSVYVRRLRAEAAP